MEEKDKDLFDKMQAEYKEKNPVNLMEEVKQEKVKFSSFMNNEKEYNLNPDKTAYFNLDKLPKFQAKE